LSFRRAAPLVLLVPLLAAPGRAQGTSEYLAKVSLLDKLSAFVDWPAAPPGRPFVLGVVGRTPFGDQLDDHFARRPLMGRPVQLRYFRGPEDLAACDLLFVCASEKARIPAILARTRGWAVLTVGDTPGFAEAGVMVNLVREGQGLAFEVNLAATREAGLRLASGFLNLARLKGAPVKP
jgi:hypothetical protein